MRKRCLINCGFWIYNWNKLCVAHVSLKEKMLKWSSSFHGRLPTFLLTVADSTVNWGLWWLMGRISPSNCGISEFWKYKNLASFQTQVEGNWPERVPQMWTNLGKFFFFFSEYPSNNSYWSLWHICQVEWVASTQDHFQRQGKHNLQVLILSWSLRGRQGNNMEDVGSSYIWISVIHSSGSKIT